MKRILSLAAVALAATAALSAQTVTARQSICKAAPAPGEASMEWMQYCDYNTTTVSGVGTNKGTPQLKAVTLLKTETLQEHKGKAISVVAIHINSTVAGGSVFVIKGDKPDEATQLTEVKVDRLAKGWNIVKLDSPVTIDATERIGVGYSLTDNSSYPLSFDGKGAVRETSYIQIADQPYSAADVAWGNLMIRALVDGDPSALGYNLVLDKLDLPVNVPAAKPVDVTMHLTNSAFETITDFSYEFTVNGKKETKEVKLDIPIANNSSAVCTFNLDPITETTNYEFNITKVNGHDNVGAASIAKTAVPYDASETFERNILIEKFTGQNCGYCPGGEVSIANAIRGMESRVVRIDHHYGYTKDIFTIEESESIGDAFGVHSAPNCMVDRRVQEERRGTKADGVVFHPGYLTEDMAANAISAPAFVGIEIDRAYDYDTRTATITVNGKTYKDLAGARLTVCLTQSGYIAYQNSADASWRHNDYPVDYMTPYNGEEIRWNTDGTFSYNYKYTIADAYGKMIPDADKMDVVAYVSRWDDDSKEVMNAATRKLTDKDTGICTPAASEAHFGFAGGQFTVDGCALGVEVYDITGTRLTNADLTAGIYIVRATVNGKQQVRKITVH